MKIFKYNLFVIAISLFITNSLYAKVVHTNPQDELFIKTKHEHTHSCAAREDYSKKNIQRAARKRLWTLVQEKKIAASWLEVPIKSTDKKQFEENVDWVVIFQDKNIQDASKQNIYIFVDFYGHVLGANYDGK